MTKPIACKQIENGGTTQELDAAKTWHARTNQSSEVLGFGVSDNKGREHGACVIRYEFNMVPFVRDEFHRYGLGYDIPEGHYFAADVQAARGGSAYGASQRTEWFHTEADREAYITERLARMRKAKK